MGAGASLLHEGEDEEHAQEMASALMEETMKMTHLAIEGYSQTLSINQKK